MSGTRAAHVVVGVEPSLAGLQALRYAVAEARRRGAVLRAVRAWQFSVPWRGYDVDECRLEMANQAAETLIETFNLALGGLPRDVVLDLVTTEGPLVPVLLAHATQDDDVLIVGTSRRRVGNWATVDGQCIRSAPCPVVAVPPPSLARQAGLHALTREVVREAQRVTQTAIDGSRHPNLG